MAKVVLVDNFGRESVADQLLAENLKKKDAKGVADKYNKLHGQNYPWYARVVKDDYKLWRGILELV